MYNVIKWLTEFAQAEEGVIPGEVIEQRVGALKEMLNWRDMKIDEFREVLTTANFPGYFGDAISRAFYNDYADQPSEWRSFVRMDSAPDFRDVDRFRMSEPGTLYERGEKAEAKATFVEETEINLGVKEFSRSIDFSWQAIQNDDLGKIRETPRRMVRAANRFEASFVSNLYDNATTQAALIAAGPVYSGTGRLTPANLALAWAAMQLRTDSAGNPIQINRVWLVVPPILKIAAQQILKDVISNGGADSNVIGDFIAGVRVDPYIATTTTALPWYLFADPAEIPGVTVMRLEGFDRPFAYSKMSDISMISGSAPAAFLMGDAQTGNVKWYVTDFIGGYSDATYGGVTDINGIYYSSGTTP